MGVCLGWRVGSGKGEVVNEQAEADGHTERKKMMKKEGDDEDENDRRIRAGRKGKRGRSRKGEDL